MTRLKEEHLLRVSERWMMRIAFGPKKTIISRTIEKTAL
jgi:hypothetical protein